MRLWNLLRTFGIAAVLLALRLIPLSATESVSLCIIYHLTGQRCPGCGMTRAFANLLRGNWERALDYNIFSPAVFLLVLILLADELLSLLYSLRGKSRLTLIERLLGYHKS